MAGGEVLLPIVRTGTAVPIPERLMPHLTAALCARGGRDGLARDREGQPDWGIGKSEPPDLVVC
jgi:hypothetical protein